MTDHHYEVTIIAQDAAGNTSTGRPLNVATSNAKTVEEAVRVAEGILVNAPNGGAARITRGNDQD